MASMQVRGYHLNLNPDEIFSTINKDESLEDGIQKAKEHCLKMQKAVTCLLFSTNPWDDEKINETKEKIWEELGEHWTFAFEKNTSNICVITIMNIQ